MERTEMPATRKKRHEARTTPAVLVFMCITLATAGAQERQAALTLDECVNAALSQGADSRILQRNLALSREQRGLSLSQYAYSLSASLGENATYGYGNQTLLVSNSLLSGFNQIPQAGIVFSMPMTSLGFTTTPYVPVSPLYTELAGFLGASPPGESGNFSLNLSQTLWNGYPGGIEKASLEKSLLALRAQELSFRTGQLAIASAATRAYFLVLSVQRNLAVKEQILEQQKGMLAQILALHDLHQATDVDLRSAQINAESAQIEIDSARSDLRIARIRLAQHIGRPPDSDLTVAEAEDPQVPVQTAQEAIAEALKRRTDIQQIDLNRQALAIDLALIKGQTLPTVSVTAGANLIVDWKLLTTAGQATLGMKVGLPILDAGAAGHELEANRLQNEIYSVQESQLRARIAADVEEAYNLVQVQLQRLRIARLASEKLDIQLEFKKKAAELGTATNQDLLDASVAAASARSAIVAAQSNAQAAILQLRSLMGYQEMSQ